MINYYKQFFSLLFVFISTSLFSQTEFITHWSAPVAPNDTLITIKTKASSGPYNYNVEWRSLQTPSFNGSVTNQIGDYEILNVPEGDTIEVKISGVFPHIHMRSSDQRNFLTKIVQWGNNPWKNMSRAFEGCEKLIITATDTPILSGVTDMGGMFSGCKRMNQPINNWDVSTITNMEDLFASDSLFNQPLDNWNVSNVTTMENMFSGALKFNQPIDGWDVSNVTNMSLMFGDAKSFNQPLNSWSVSNVTNMFGMFNGALVFNKPLDSWVVSNVTTTEKMFLNAENFNQDIITWDVSSVTKMNEMFKNAVSFKQSLADWDVSSVEQMDEMFNNAISFNKPVNDWDVSSVESMNKMFFGATFFDQAINNWDITNVNDVTDMLSGTAMSYCNYDDALIAWLTLPGVPTNLTFGALGVKYSSKGQNSRTLMNTYHNWTIADAGLQTGTLEVVLEASDTTFCAEVSTILSATSNEIGTVFQWNQSLPNGDQNTVAPMTTTEYIVTGINSLGCTNTDTLEIVVIQPPTIVLQANHLSICAGESVSLTASGGIIYSWNLGLGSAANVTSTPLTDTEYIVVGTNIYDCTSADTLTVVVNANPSVDLQANVTTICSGETVNLTASGATSYSWNQGLAAGATKSVTPSFTKTYIVTGLNAEGCKDSDTLKVIVNELPVVTLQANKTTICNGQTVNLVASGASSYAWNNGLTAGSTKTVNPSTTTQYIVTGTDANGCTGADTISIVVNLCLDVENIDLDFVNLYPNPSSEFITLKGENLSTSFHTMFLVDLTGKVLFTSPISQSEKTISVSELVNGIYFVNLVGKQNKTFKIEVKH